MRAADERMRDLDRIRWRCRRGLLELDLVLAGFVRTELERLSAAELTAFGRLLEAADNDLWDWISTRSEPADAGLAALVSRLRSVRIVA
jgi:antitoxin CptB